MRNENTRNAKKTRALFVGRFQPFHNGHLSVVRSLLGKQNGGRALFDEVILVVGSAEESTSFDNPFTAGERIEMIRSCFSENQSDHVNELPRIVVVPIRDINNNSLWVSHVISHVPKFKTVYSNNWLVKYLFSRANAGINVSKITFFDRKNCEGKKIRKMMASGKNQWKKYVPKQVADFIESIGGVERMANITLRAR